MAIAVVDLNEGDKEVEEEPTIIEEATEQVEQAGDFLNSNEVGVEPIDTFVSNEVVEEHNEEVKDEGKEEVKEEVKPKAKPKPKPKAGDLVNCPDCQKQMTYKNLRYSHKCYPEPPPVKKQAKPKAKQQPKPKISTQEIYEEEQQEQQPVKFKLIKPTTQPANTITSLQQHYQLLQNEYMKQKQDKYNKLCSNMFSTKIKNDN